MDKAHRELPDRIVREDEVASMTGLSRSARFELEKRGAFPRRRIIVGRHTGWLMSEVAEWVRARPTVAVGSVTSRVATIG